MEEKKKLTRSNNKMVGGVCAGIGEYLGIDPTIIRIVYVLMIFFAGFGILLYLILWLIMPAKPIQ
ncbi:PspC family transcriptional regulator [Parabacteroides sp. An277]|uniref:PspC domain-containing protein n=1 Tax=Parabacteroides sp. An277 TaxID=1965619 RepID=UPI000B399CCE|nr:PspC domain-containing protein [Parabacteroides sp. An277]OUO53517.1 PspC family transcriptional regulator [Parabacteroides sp. An277]